MKKQKENLIWDWYNNLLLSNDVNRIRKLIVRYELFKKSLSGGEGKYGFLDIIKNYKGTPAAKLARFSAGMAYLNLNDYKNALIFLDEFSSDDVLLSALSKGAIGDAFAQIDQPEDAYQYYLEAAKINNNLYKRFKRCKGKSKFA